MTKLVTKNSLQEMLNNDRLRMHVIGRALVVLFNNQLDDEKQSNDTRHDNGIGFSGADARSGTLTAKYYLKHRRLMDWQIEMWYKKNIKGFSRIAKYHGQLNDAAEVKTRENDFEVIEAA